MLVRAAVLLVLLAACKTARPILVAPGGPAARPTLFSGVHVFDGAADLGTLDVLTDGARIARLERAGSIELPPGAERIEGNGRTLLPGLIDCHVHLGAGDGNPPWVKRRPNVEAQAAALLYAGVTTVLTATRDEDPIEMRARIAVGEIAGPRIFASSRAFTAPGGHPVGLLRAVVPWPVSSFLIAARVAQVSTPAEARAAVDEDLASPEISFVKIMLDSIPKGAAQITPEVMTAVIAQTRARGRRAIVHAARPADAMAAVEAGASALMHVPWESALTPEQIAKLQAVPVVTTVRFPEVIGQVLRGVPQLDALEREVMPPGMPEAFADRPAGYQVPGFSPEELADFPRMDAQMSANMRALFDAGVMLLAGTDSGLPAMLHGAALHRELQKIVALGVPPPRALRMATADAARFLEKAADFGRIAPGMQADLLLVEGDPLVDISATERIVAVWQGGRKLLRGPR